MAVIPDLKTEPEATSEVLTLQTTMMIAAMESIMSWITGVMEKVFITPLASANLGSNCGKLPKIAITAIPIRKMIAAL
ncbi:hypothetical protein SDC9_131598 [bioreactor metagenome]|uniref:Uncharacterized protein n=1 Tax=bioreactor metagenome TaxID=1076179 RepID=A0A645D5N5_9ZZZZ